MPQNLEGAEVETDAVEADVTIEAEIAEVVAVVDTVVAETETTVVETAEAVVEIVVKEEMMVVHLVENTKEVVTADHSVVVLENLVAGVQKTSVAPVVAEI